ncbi:MAG: DUF433 domain-containing protein [Bacteroidota bacterium]
MTTFVDDTLKEAKRHSRAEQTRLIAELQKLVMPEESRLVFPGVFQTPGIAGGLPCLGATRIPVFRVVKFLTEAVPEKEILEIFPSLNLYDLEVAKSYYAEFSEAVQLAITEEE